MQKEHEAVQKAVLPHLSNSRANSRKKVWLIHLRNLKHWNQPRFCLGDCLLGTPFTLHWRQALRFARRLLDRQRRKDDQGRSHSYFHPSYWCYQVSAILFCVYAWCVLALTRMNSRSVGFRLGKFMSKVIPLIVKYSNDPRFKKDDELKENCFQVSKRTLTFYYSLLMLA